MGIKIIFVFLEFLFQAFNFSYELAFYLGPVLAPRTYGSPLFEQVKKQLVKVGIATTDTQNLG